MMFSFANSGVTLTGFSLEFKQKMQANTVLQALQTHAQPGKITAAKVIQIAVYCVEQLAANIKQGMTSQEKLHAAVGMLPGIIEQAHNSGMCDAAEAAALTATLTTWGNNIAHIIGIVVDAAHNPELIQAAKDMKQWCKVHCARKQ